ncbi:MAG TPA: folate-binding protein [Burkholderiaceae bacterium]|nr:folate-binding protein [Burkholderiaceae bacterium]HQR71546.1 folate-binding protein [Burkholderiaceae bacterium]
MPELQDTTAPLGAFSAPPSELESVLREAALVRLDELGRICVDGLDAVTFLQSQLTSDVAHLSEAALQLNGYCTAKGRLLATFHQWRDGDAVMLQLPAEILAPVTKRLSMFVLRARAKLTDASALHTTFGLLGPGAAAALRAAGFDVPDAPWGSAVSDGVRVSRLLPAPHVGERFLLTAASDKIAAIGSLAAQRRASAAWWWSEVAAAVPTVFAATQEKFVPQMINFEVLGGVNFKKGCYPGQEVVARSQYLGKLKRRMQVAHADTAEAPAAGADVFHSSQVEAIGTVVMSAAAPGGGVDLLFELPVDRLETGTLHLGSGAGPRLNVRRLPYELFDPTA